MLQQFSINFVNLHENLILLAFELGETNMILCQKIQALSSMQVFGSVRAPSAGIVFQRCLLQSFLEAGYR
jgi:hypothetical protein